jgi:hypothetical protein
LLGSNIDLTKCWILATGRCDCTADGRKRVYAESSIRGQSLRGSVAGRRQFNGGLAQASTLLTGGFPIVEKQITPKCSGNFRTSEEFAQKWMKTAQHAHLKPTPPRRLRRHPSS